MNKEMILSILMALGVVFGGITLLNKSLMPMAQKEAEINPTPNIEEDEPRRVAKRTYAQETPETYQEALEAVQIPPAAIDATGIVIKCTISGTVIYADKPCPKNGKASQVEIYESAGVVTPSRDTVNRTMRRIEEERRRENQGTRSSLSVIEKPNKQLCNAYRADIDKYNSMARQPQSGSAQDWIRGEIVRIRKLQAQANC